MKKKLLLLTTMSLFIPTIRSGAFLSCCQGTQVKTSNEPTAAVVNVNNHEPTHEDVVVAKKKSIDSLNELATLAGNVNRRSRQNYAVFNNAKYTNGSTVHGFEAYTKIFGEAKIAHLYYQSNIDQLFYDLLDSNCKVIFSIMLDQASRVVSHKNAENLVTSEGAALLLVTFKILGLKNKNDDIFYVNMLYGNESKTIGDLFKYPLKAMTLYGKSYINKGDENTNNNERVKFYNNTKLLWKENETSSYFVLHGLDENIRKLTIGSQSHKNCCIKVENFTGIIKRDLSNVKYVEVKTPSDSIDSEEETISANSSDLSN